MKIQLLKSGYIIFKDVFDLNMLNELGNVIINQYKLDKYNNKENMERIPCGGAGVCDNTVFFSYYLEHGAECYMSDIKTFIKHNIWDKRDGERCKPFNKNVSFDKGFYISFTEFEDKYKNNIKEINKDIQEEIENILNWFNKQGLQCEFKELTFNEPYYL